MDEKIIEKLDTLIVIELIKAGAKRDQVRKILPISNELFAKINAILGKK